MESSNPSSSSTTDGGGGDEGGGGGRGSLDTNKSTNFNNESITGIGSTTTGSTGDPSPLQNPHPPTTIASSSSSCPVSSLLIPTPSTDQFSLTSSTGQTTTTMSPQSPLAASDSNHRPTSPLLSAIKTTSTTTTTTIVIHEPPSPSNNTTITTTSSSPLITSTTSSPSMVTTTSPSVPTTYTLEEVLCFSDYTSRVEFGLKLGYTETQVQTSLMRIGPNSDQNQLLAELIKLGNCELASSPKSLVGGHNRSPHHRHTVHGGHGHHHHSIHGPHGQHTSSSGIGGMIPLSPSLSCPSSLITTSPSSPATGTPSSLLPGKPQPLLRPIVIDGSNVAMTHGKTRVFSCRGIKIAVDWFRARGHKEIFVFVPMWRKETPRPDAPMTEQEVLFELEAEGFITYTPSRVVGGRRVNCHDDPFILKHALSNGGVIVSNDNYRELITENPDYKKVVEERLLMYTFASDHFMPPDDPLGRGGPSLEAFLKMPSSSTGSLTNKINEPCPYAQKCTYGHKCKYYHPEREGGHKTSSGSGTSVADRLVEQAKAQLAEVKSRSRGQQSSRETSPGEQKMKACHTSSLPPSLLGTNGTAGQGRQKQALMRTKSVVPGVGILPNPPTPPTTTVQHDVLGRSNSCRAGSGGTYHRDHHTGSSAGSGSTSSTPHKPLGASISARVFSSSSCADLGYDGSHSFDHPGYHPPLLPQHHHHLHGHSTFLNIGHQQQQMGQQQALHHTLLPGHQSDHSSIGKRYSDPSSTDSGFRTFSDSSGGDETTASGSPDSTVAAGAAIGLHRKLARQLTLNPTFDPRLEEIPGHQTITPRSSECASDSCLRRRRELESDLIQIRREMKAQEERINRLEKENQFLRACRESHGGGNDTANLEVLMSALTAMQEKNAHLELSLSAETKLKLDLFSVLGDTKRQLEICQSAIAELNATVSAKDREIDELNSKIAGIMACMPAAATVAGQISPFSIDDPVDSDGSSSLFSTKYHVTCDTMLSPSSPSSSSMLSPSNREAPSSS